MVEQYSDIFFEIVTIDDLFSDKEINMFLEWISNNNGDDIRPFTTSNFKNGKIINPEISKLFYKKIRPYLPEKYIDRNNDTWSYLDSCKYVYYSIIKENQNFMIHTDTGAEYDLDNNIFSKYTCLLYLNDDFTGGTTSFYTNELKKTVTIQPKKGRLLIFDIDLFHAGDMVTSGIKNWIGTELICKKH